MRGRCRHLLSCWTDAPLCLQDHPPPPNSPGPGLSWGALAWLPAQGGPGPTCSGIWAPSSAASLGHPWKGPCVGHRHPFLAHWPPYPRALLRGRCATERERQTVHGCASLDLSCRWGLPELPTPLAFPCKRGEGWGEVSTPRALSAPVGADKVGINFPHAKIIRNKRPEMSLGPGQGCQQMGQEPQHKGLPPP